MKVNLLQEYLKEELLNEDLNTSYEYYKDKLTREQFNELIALDPTFLPEQDRLGTFGKWIIAAFLTGRLKKEEFNMVQEILGDFESRKRYITTPGGKDVNKYKTLGEVRDVLNTIQLTDNQREKLRRKAKQHVELGTEAEFLFENDEWEVWSPRTYAASMKLGSGSSWCTASTGSSGERYFHDYTDRWASRRGNEGECGDLYIFNNKKNQNIKFQLQVVSDSNKKPIKTGDFMDINDRSDEFDGFIIKHKLADELQQTILKDLPEVKSAIAFDKLSKTGTITLQSPNTLDVTLSSLEDGTPIRSSWLKGNTDIKEFIFTATDVGDIYKELFDGPDFKHVERIVFKPESSVHTILPKAFRGCVNLKEIVLPPKLVNIGEEAFSGCSSLGEVFLPDTVRYIGFNAFKDCSNLVLKMNKRKGKTNIQVPEANLDFLKQHLQILGAETQPVTESLDLLEDYTKSMPQWLRKFLNSNTERSNELKNLLTGGPSRSKYDKQLITEKGPIDLNNANFISAPVPTSPRDKLLRDPYIPFLHLNYKHRRSDEGIVEDVYLIGVNDEQGSDWDYNGTPYGETSKTTMLGYTINFAYLDKNDPANFVDLKFKGERSQAKQGSVNRMTPAQMARMDKEKEKSGRSYRDDYVDKSGYKLDPNNLIKKLNAYNKANYSKVLKNYYNRLMLLRKGLHQELVSLDIKNPRYDESTVRDAHEKLFNAIDTYRSIVGKLEDALNTKNKEDREMEFNMIFRYDNTGSTTFEGLRKQLLKLEKSLQAVGLTTLESLEEK